MAIKSFSSLIAKNMKILFRSKFSTFTIILFPLIVMLFVGFAFDSSGIQGISVGVYSNSSSSLETEIVTGLSNQGFIVSSFNYSQNCIESIKLNEIQVCLVFPEGFSDTGSVDEVKIYVDSSRINLAYSVLHEIENQVSNSSSILGTSLAGNLINTLNSVKTTLNEDKSKLDESIDNSKEIDLITSKFDETFEMEEELSNLRLIKSKLNSSSDISKIDSVISKIEDLDDYLSSSSSGFYQISKYNDESSEMFDNVISDIDKLTKEISSSNVFEAETISSPVKTEIVYVNGEENNLDYMLPTIISLIALFGGILLSASFILKERKTKAYFRNFMTPTINFTFLFADYATCLLVLMCQFILVFLGIYFIFGISIPIHYGEFFVLILLSLSVFIFIGTFIGYLFKSEEAIIFTSVLVASLMMLFSNTILPIETFLGSLKDLARFNPFVICDSALRKIMLFNYGYNNLLTELYILGIFAITFFLLSLIWRKFTKNIL